VHIDGQTLAAFQSTIAGNASANAVVDTIEPASIFVLGAGLFGLGLVRWRSQRSSATAA